LVMSMKFIDCSPVLAGNPGNPLRILPNPSSGVHPHPLILFRQRGSRDIVSPLRHPMIFPNLAPGTRLLWIPPVPDDRRAPVPFVHRLSWCFRRRGDRVVAAGLLPFAAAASAELGSISAGRMPIHRARQRKFARECDVAG
jgi:hypothetical protein